MQRVILIILTAIFFGGCSTEDSIQEKSKETYTSVLLSPYEVSAPFLGSDNKYHLIYGLTLTNSGRLDAKVEKIEVINSNRTLHVLDGDSLISFLYHLNSDKAKDNAIERDGSRILFVSLTFDSKESIPNEVEHRVTVLAAAGPGSKEVSEQTYEVTRLAIPKKNPVVIASPLRGERWVIFNGCCSFMGVHQASMHPINGQLYNAQRFAMDMMKLDTKGQLVEGDPNVLTNWTGYHEDVYAVADGVVISVLEGLPDQKPGELPDPNSITVKNYTGNHIVLKIDEGAYAFYAHLCSGSIKVKEGDRVKKGDKIAKLGNSGNTSAPHLHLHLTESPSPMGSNPVPYVFESFLLVDKVEPKRFYEADSLEGSFADPEEFKPKEHKTQYPLDLSVVDYQ